jgi:hypothetical protein
MERLKQLKGKDAEATNKLRKETEELIKETLSLNDANRQAGNQWWHVEKSINDANESINKISENIKQAIKDRASELTSLFKDYADELDKIMDAEEKAHQKRLDDIKEEKEEFDNYIDEKIKAIKREKEASDYSDDISDLTDELAKLQNERAKYSMAAASGDAEAISKIAELDEKIANKKEEIEDKQNDRKYKLRIENLQDLKESYDEELEEAKDKENKKYEAMKETYEKLKSDIKEFSEAGINATSSMIYSIIEEYNNLYDNFSSSTKKMAATFEDEFIAKLKAAQEQLTLLQSQLGIDTSSNTSASTISFSESLNSSSSSSILKSHTLLGDGFEKMSSSEFAKYKQNKKNYESGINREEAASENAALRKKYGITSDKYSYEDLVGYYDQGGVNTKTGLAMLHGTPTAPELILNNEQASKLYNLITNLPNSLTRLIPNFNFNISKIVSAGNARYGDIVLNVSMPVYGNVDQSTANAITSNFATTLKSTLTKAGIINR